MKPGETVLVNAAAGAVGSVVGQLAKIGVGGLSCSYLLLRSLNCNTGQQGHEQSEGQASLKACPH